MMSTENAIRPTIFRTYGDNGMSRALVVHLAERIDAYGQGHDRPNMVMRICWDWFSGGDTADRASLEIEAALQAEAAGF